MLSKKVEILWLKVFVAWILVFSQFGPVQAACTDPLGCVTLGASDPIHIAYLLTKTGGAAAIGLEEIRGVELAIDDSGGKILGHIVQFDGQDGKCNPTDGATAGDVLDNDSTIVAVIGTTCSGEAFGAMPFLSTAGFSVVSPSNTNPLLTKPGDPNHYPGYLRVSWNDTIQGATAADYAYTTLGLTTAAIINDGSPYSTGLAQIFSDEFTTLGGTITTQETIVTGNNTTIDTALATIAGTPPALLYIPVFAQDGVYILDHLPAGLAGVQIFSADGMYDSSVNTASNEEGLWLTSYDFTTTRNPNFVTKFLPAYVAKYGSGPTNNWHSHAYDAFMIIKAAIESVAVVTSPGVHEIGRQALRDALYGTTNHNGMTGAITCDVNGDCADASMSVYQFHANQFPPKYLTPEKVGLVMDPAGPGDLSFNYMALQGILQAETTFSIPITLYWPADFSEVQTSLERCADEGNGLCFGVGFSMGTAIENAAASRPATNFSLLDMSFDTPPANLRGIVFDSKQIGYLAGRLAGRMSTSDTVGVVAGMNIPPVTSFVEGFRNGAQCSGNTDVLINYTGTFGDPAVGEAAAADMISLGADVIYGVAGPTGNGAILYSAQNGVWSIGVDTDQYLTVFDDGGITGSNKLLTSTMKRLDNAILLTTDDHLNGLFASGNANYGLVDDGVGLAPYHETDTVIPQLVKDEIAALELDIIAGNVNTDFACRPRFHAEILENDVFGVDWPPFTDVTLEIDDPANGSSVDFTDTLTTNDMGFVMFDNLGGLALRTDTLVTMTDGTYNKLHTIVPLTVTGVSDVMDRVWGTGIPGHVLNIQHCDNVGCSWRRMVTVQPNGTWLADFATPGGSSTEEQNLLNIQPGMQGEALYPDSDADHTDVQWVAPIYKMSIGANDGQILESTETSNTGGTMNSTATTFNLGDETLDRQYRAILHFDTSSLPDTAVITSAVIQIRRHSTVGTNPFSILGALKADLRKVSFGGTALELLDFRSAANKNNIAVFSISPVANWYSGTLNAMGRIYINKTGVTQFRLYFTKDDNDDMGADFMRFYSGNSSASTRPKLVISFYVP